MADPQLAAIIEKAIQREIEAYDFYMDLAGRVRDESARDTLEFIAGEERKHRDFLTAYRDGGYAPGALRMTDVVYYKIAEYEQAPEPTAEMSDAEIFLVAAHRELQSYNFYTTMAEAHAAGQTRDILLKMANEELKHKEKMEYLYTNTSFAQTSGG